MIRSIPSILALAIAIGLHPTSARADGGSHHHVHVGTNTGGLTTGVSQNFPGHSSDEGTGEDPPGVDHTDASAVPTVSIENGLLETFCSGVTRSDWCVPDPATPGTPPEVTPGIVATAFRNLPLPASQLIVQPPGGETLVNFATNFYTEQGQLDRTVHLLGQRVDLKIWPSQFGWRFGDGRSLATESAGSPYPDLEITHEYAREGGVRPSVDTTYAARFRVNGGPWRDVNGTVTIPGTPVQLQVRTATPVLVGYH
ncbi:MAG: hypothetical protein JWO76_847 [Nocardioides sp.]|nr:hypothetical protein [Nocardioides sp.]